MCPAGSGGTHDAGPMEFVDRPNQLAALLGRHTLPGFPDPRLDRFRHQLTIALCKPKTHAVQGQRELVDFGELSRESERGRRDKAVGGIDGRGCGG
jgi:hypothetical protein